MAALLAATTMVAGASPAMVRAQDLRMDEGPRARPEGGPPRGGPGGPAGRLERSEGRPLFNDRASFPENRPAFRPDHAEAPRQVAPRPEPAPPPPGRGDRGDPGGWRDGPRPAPGPDQARPDRGGPDGVRIDRGNGRDDRPGGGRNWNNGGWNNGGWNNAPRDDRRAQWQEQQRRDQRWQDDQRRQRGDRDRWRRSYGDWRDHNDQAYGFGERRAWADQWNRGWRRDRRYDWLGWRSLNRGAYHLPRYYAPYGGYSYQRFSSGVILEPMFFDQNYWLGDPYAYRLPPAYGSYRWVRYYNDAILVDLRSGLVVDVVYDIFW